MTYSIVARDPETGDLGVAVQSHWFSVGSVVTWAEAGVGAVATQAFANPDYGPSGLSMMREGTPAPEALRALVQADGGRDVRQVAMVDAHGNAGAHSGRSCIAAAGHVTGDGFSVQANMMANATVWPAMRDAFTSANGDLADRLLAALDAAEAAGGDIRGQQSAAILVVGGDRHDKPWQGVRFDVRVEDHIAPLVELRRLVRVRRAYAVAEAADEALGRGHADEAVDLYRQAAAIAPEIDELMFWSGLSLLRQSHADEGERMLRASFVKNPALADLVERLVPLGMVASEDVERIVALRAGA